MGNDRRSKRANITADTQKSVKHAMTDPYNAHRRADNPFCFFPFTMMFIFLFSQKCSGDYSLNNKIPIINPRVKIKNVN
jgi:hypothetical protein